MSSATLAVRIVRKAAVVEEGVWVVAVASREPNPLHPILLYSINKQIRQPNMHLDPTRVPLAPATLGKERLGACGRGVHERCVFGVVVLDGGYPDIRILEAR